MTRDQLEDLVEWYFDQTRYSVSYSVDDGYLIHDSRHGRYSQLIHPEEGFFWPSAIEAIAGAITHEARSE